MAHKADSNGDDTVERRKRSSANRSTAKEEAAASPVPSEDAAVRIVAIGASAGGLEPIEQFFDNIPNDCGLTFVVIQHLSPDFKSMMNELISRHSKMHIERIEDGMLAKPNVIYLNPPRKTLTIQDGIFRLEDVDPTLSLHLPIDSFFETLAEEAGSDAVAIVLSGTGSDGTQGAVAVRHAGGVVLVQDPATTKFDGMPTSIIRADLSNAIGNPEYLAELVQRIARGEDASTAALEKDLPPIGRVFQLLRDRFNTDFGHYKNATIQRRLLRRIEFLGVKEVEEYVTLLEDDTNEVEALYADFLIEVTKFYRDPKAFAALDDDVIPELLSRMEGNQAIRIWVPGCASGEEAYSLAIKISEAARLSGQTPNLKILATDIHHRSLQFANAGLYSDKAVNDLPVAIRDRYFELVGDRWQVTSVLRQMIVFSVHNVLSDPPFTRIDLISCRNLLIYFNDKAQQKSLAYFHFALRKNGLLFLGPSETTGKLSEEFEELDKRWRIFRKRRDVRLTESMTQLSQGIPQRSIQNVGSAVVPVQRPITFSRPRNVGDTTLDLLLSKFAPAGFLLRHSGEIVRVFGEGGKYLEIGEGDFLQRIDALVRADLRTAVAAALDRARTPDLLPFERRVRSKLPGDDHRSLVVKLERIHDQKMNADLLLMTITGNVDTAPPERIGSASLANGVEDTETASLLRETIADLEHELQSSEETLQSTIEELETSNEEMQATNEELMASNEELQSTNEELHSVNEELYTVSAEHQRKIVELTEMTGDMEHLLRATEIGTIFVDGNMQVRRFTPAAGRVFNILEQDVGRPFEHITNRFGGIDMVQTLRDVIENGIGQDIEVEIDEESVLLRILPYLKTPHDIAGAVITSIDISALKREQRRTQSLATQYEGIVADLDDFIFRWSAKDRTITFCNNSFLDMIQFRKEDVIGQPLGKVIPKGQRREFMHSFKDLKVGEAASFLLNDGGTGAGSTWREGTIRAIGPIGKPPVEYQAVGRDISIATAYRLALEKLSAIPYDLNESDDEAMTRILEIGSEFYGMPVGIFSNIADDEYRVVAITGGDLLELEPGAVLPLGKTYCVDLVNRTEPLAIYDVEECEYNKHPAYDASGLESYIGRKIEIDNDTVGAVNFASRTARQKPFSELEVNFIQVLAEWIGRRAERSKAITGLRRINEDLQLVIDTVPARIWYKDDQNRIVRLNQTAAQSMGLSVEEATGADTYDLFPEMAKKYHEDDLKVIESGVPMLDIIEEYTPRDGQRGWSKTDKVPYIDATTGDRRLLVISIDVSVMKAQEQRVSELNDELSVKNDQLLNTNQSLKQFAHVASHDLQEPLRKLTQFTEYLVDDCGEELSKDGRYFVDVIAGSAKRMRGLVRDILALSSASGKQLDYEQLDMAAVTNELISEMEITIEETGAKIDIGDLPTIVGDATLVEQLLRNLLSNALKYRVPERNPVIGISAEQTIRGHQISIADNGIGIDEEHFKTVFDPFTRLHDRKTYGGTGIGLAVCRTVCDRHGWVISVDSEIGQGSTFRILIPPQASLVTDA